MDRHGVAIVIPAFNEQNTIEKVVAVSLLYGSPIVVDDASSDNTAKIAEKAGSVVVKHNTNRGYDSALDSGFAEAEKRGFDYVITVDADAQHNPHYIKKYIHLLKNGADVVTGLRPRKQRLFESVTAFFTNFMYGIKDPHCGMKGYKISVYRNLGHFDSYGSVGSELILFAAKNGMKIVQIPIPITPREDAPRFGRVLNSNLRIFKALLIGVFKYSGFRRPMYPILEE